jgi:hypothetical protein
MLKLLFAFRKLQLDKNLTASTTNVFEYSRYLLIQNSMDVFGDENIILIRVVNARLICCDNNKVLKLMSLITAWLANIQFK